MTHLIGELRGIIILAKPGGPDPLGGFNYAGLKLVGSDPPEGITLQITGSKTREEVARAAAEQVYAALINSTEGD